MCVLTHLYVWHDSFVGATWLIRMWDMTHSTKHSRWPRFTLMCVIWLVYLCAMTHSDRQQNSSGGNDSHWYVCHASLICVLWLVYLCAMTHSDRQQNSSGGNDSHFPLHDPFWNHPRHLFDHRISQFRASGSPNMSRQGVCLCWVSLLLCVRHFCYPRVYVCIYICITHTCMYIYVYI